MEEEKKVCPCCGRHCDLTNPSCERGREYAKTGVIPERKDTAEGGHEHAFSGEHHGHGFGGEYHGHGHDHGHWHHGHDGQGGHGEQ